jgi:hypothetical protein
MATLQIGNQFLTTSPARDAFATLRKQYADIGNRYKARLVPEYRTFETIEDLLGAFAEHVEGLINETADAAAADIAAHQIYSVSRDALVADLWLRAEAVSGEVAAIQSRYLEIIGKSAELGAQRTADRENRGRIAGGGFGVAGAAQGMAIAVAANAAIGIFYGLANATAKGASMWGDRKRKRALLQDSNTTAALQRFLSALALQGAEIVADTVNGKGDTGAFATVPADAQTTAAALLENFHAGRVPDAQRAVVLFEGLELDPFDSRLWQAWVDYFGDNDNSVEASATAIGAADLSNYKRELIDTRRTQLPWDSPEQCHTSGTVLEELSTRLGLPFEHERARIAQLSIQLDRDRRTFSGVVYESAEAKQAAQVAYEFEQKRLTELAAERRTLTFNGVVYDTKEEARAASRQYDLKLIRLAIVWVGLPIALVVALVIWQSNSEPQARNADNTLVIEHDNSSPLSRRVDQTKSQLSSASPLARCQASNGEIHAVALDVMRQISNSNSFNHRSTKTLTPDEQGNNVEMTFIAFGMKYYKTIRAQVDPSTCALVGKVDLSS